GRELVVLVVELRLQRLEVGGVAELVDAPGGEVQQEEDEGGDPHPGPLAPDLGVAHRLPCSFGLVPCSLGTPPSPGVRRRVGVPMPRNGSLGWAGRVSGRVCVRKAGVGGAVATAGGVAGGSGRGTGRKAGLAPVPAWSC